MQRQLVLSSTTFFLIFGAYIVREGAASSEWDMPEPYREIQQMTLRSRRDLLLRMIDSMPTAQLRSTAYPGQRDFAEQIHHTAALDAFAMARVLGLEPPTFPDTSVALSTKSGLRQIVAVGFDWLDRTLITQTARERNSVVSFAGREIPRWQLFDEINEHSMWTAGQIVANFRALGMAPPAFRFF